MGYEGLAHGKQGPIEKNYCFLSSCCKHHQLKTSSVW